MEVLRNTLLMGLLIMLVYVLYKRLLKILGKDETLKKYPALAANATWIEKKLIVQFELFQAMAISIEVFDQHGSEIQKVQDQVMPVGKHEVAIDTTGVSAGKYYFKLTSPKEVVSQYFEVK